MKKLKTYLVGGAVRDSLLGVVSQDLDYIVVGSTPEEMLSLGFKQVGADFPVFLHPETGEEYALARTERKTGKGYGGFSVEFSPKTTLEEDLARRDLTINAIAFDEETMEYIDPFNGKFDLKNRILRHTSPAFSEDPLRILRLARFYARYPDFTVAEETKALCREIATELVDLTPERIWKEFEKLFLDSNKTKPSRFFYLLEEVGALSVIMPELSALKDVPQTAEHHPEICSFIHTMMVLDRAFELCQQEKERFSEQEIVAMLFSALTHDLGKGITPKELLPKHLEHEIKGVPLIKQVCERLKTPNLVRELALLVGEEHLKIHKAFELNPKTLVKYFVKWDLSRKFKRIEMMTLVCQADHQGRLTFETRPYPQRQYLINFFTEIKKVRLSQEKLALLKEKIKNSQKLALAIKDFVYKERLSVAKAFKQNQAK